MRHRVAGYKLGRTTAHRRAMMRNMANSLIEHERIVTTLIRAKALRPYVEKLVTLGRESSTARRRRAFAELRDKRTVEKLFDVLGPRFLSRAGGYTRILRMNRRRLGDNGVQAIVEFVERTPAERSEAEPAAQAAEAKGKAKAKAAAAKA